MSAFVLNRNYELILPEGYVSVENEEMEYVDGGARWYDGIKAFFAGITGTVGLLSILAGPTVTTMGIGALLSCGPFGWAILGIAGVGAVATGFSTVAAWKRR